MPESLQQPEHRQIGRRQRAERRARWAEVLAAAVLVAKGYRILATRAQTGSGEIDIIAKRGRRLAFVEVKQRPNLAAAEQAVPPHHAERLHRAALAWMRRHGGLSDHSIGYDRFDVASVWRFRHAIDALQPTGNERNR